jgi:hypothetical protein
VVLWSIGLLGVVGCRDETEKASSRSRSAQASETLPTDKQFVGTRSTPFHEVRLQVCDRPRANPVIHRFPLETQRALERLQRNACYTVTVFVHPKRAIMQLPPRLAGGRNLELILNTASTRAVLMDRAEKRFWWSSPAKLVDILEGAPPIRRYDFKTRFLDAKPVKKPRLGEKKVVRLDTLTEYLREPTTSGEALQCRLDYSVWHGRAPSLPRPSGRMLVNLALLIMGQSNEARFLKKIRAKVDVPLRWNISIRCRQWAETRFPVTRQVRLLKRPDGSLASVIHLPSNRAALPPPEAERRFGPAGAVNRQEIPPKLLRVMRPPLGLPGEPRRGDLRVKNKSGRCGIIFLDGVRLGTVGPNTDYLFRGLPAGYYRIAGTTPFGTHAWGPQDLYVPGTWTIGSDPSN